MKGQDWLGDTINLLRHESKEVYGYYSVIFNNNAFINHPEWRITPRPPLLGGAFHGRRYGQVCPNHP